MSLIKEDNLLFPVFLKLEEVPLLIVGGGPAAHEKLTAVLSHSPYIPIQLVAPQVSDVIKQLALENDNLNIHERPFEENDLNNTQLVICAIQNKEKAQHICNLAKQKGILVNVAHAPELSDFYLGSVEDKGNETSSVNSVKQERNEKFHERRWKKAATWTLFAFLFMIFGHAILSYVP